MEIAFLTLDEVITIHKNQIELYGGVFGIRDIGLLKSAIAIPSAGFDEHYFHNDLFEMAAAYLFHIICNHPFTDGNKRTGVVAALVFLELNGVSIQADENEFYNIIEKVAAGKKEIAKNIIADFLRQNISK